MQDDNIYFSHELPDDLEMECYQCHHKALLPEFQQERGVVESIKYMVYGTRVLIRTRCPNCEGVGELTVEKVK